MADLIGDEISIEEMPQGCIITQTGKMESIIISSEHDALMVIQSLRKMIGIMHQKEVRKLQSYIKELEAKNAQLVWELDKQIVRR